MTERIYISDMDNTLINNRVELSEFSRVNLNNMIENGLNFTVASARSVESIRKILEGVNINMPVIEFNGAFISDFDTGEHFIINEINHDVKYQLMELIKSYEMLPLISSYDGERDLLNYEDISNQGIAWYVEDRKINQDSRLRRVENIKEALNCKVVCFTVIDRFEKLVKLRDRVMEDYSEYLEVHCLENYYSPGWFWLTLHDRRATKDYAIKELLDMIGLSGANLTVFGDNDNDIKMFNYARTAVAVGNAGESVKKHADIVIGTNEEDSVVKYIMRDMGIES